MLNPKRFHQAAVDFYQTVCYILCKDQFMGRVIAMKSHPVAKIRISQVTELSLWSLVLFAVIAGFITLASFRQTSGLLNTTIYSSDAFPQAEQPLLPIPDDQNELPDILQSACPINTGALTISRRNHESLILRWFRDGKTGIPAAEIILSGNTDFATDRQILSGFIFQTFIQHSLPPRASPAAV